MLQNVMLEKGANKMTGKLIYDPAADRLAIENENGTLFHLQRGEAIEIKQTSKFMLACGIEWAVTTVAADENGCWYLWCYTKPGKIPPGLTVRHAIWRAER